MKPVFSDLPIILWSKLNRVGVSLALPPIKCLTFFLVASIVALVVSVTPLNNSNSRIKVEYSLNHTF